MSMSNENLELYSANYYEVAIDFDYPLVRREHYPVVSDDTTNGIKYILGFPTMEYCAFLLISIVDISNRQNSRRIPLPVRLMRASDSIRRFGNDEQELSLQNLLPRMIGELSLKIETTDGKSLGAFRKYKTLRKCFI